MSQTEVGQREATETSAEVKGKIVEFAWWLKKQGRSEITIETYISVLRLLVKAGADLTNPESIKELLASLNKSNAWKFLASAAYTTFLQIHGKSWRAPSYKLIRKIPFIPTEQEIDALIASCGPKTASFLQLLKETGLRAGETVRLRWTDVDLERRIITLNEPEKGGNPRIFRVSEKLASMLGFLPRKNERVFGNNYESLERTFQKSRRLAAKKLANPRPLRICFRTLRHWKATIEYHRTKDILRVKELLGHKRVDTTALYIQLEAALFNNTPDEFTVRIARTPEEIKALLEVGFEYVCEKNEELFFRKRK